MMNVELASSCCAFRKAEREANDSLFPISSFSAGRCYRTKAPAAEEKLKQIVFSSLFALEILIHFKQRSWKNFNHLKL
jgi:hypothetical protein